MSTPGHLLHLRLASFGKVALADSVKVHRSLDREVAEWPSMTFRFRGGAVLEPIGDDSAWATLEGDVEQLIEMANLVVRVVKRLGFLVDRRLPRTLVRVGRITPATTETYLQRLLDRLESYAGPEWTCRDLVLLRVTDSAEGADPTFEVLHRLALKPRGRHL